MNKPLAIFGATAGALCAFFLTVAMPSFGGISVFNSCSLDSDTAPISRDLLWNGSDSVEIRVPGSVHFKVGPQWRAVVEGPADVIKHLRIRNGRIEFDRSFNVCEEDVKIELTGPAVQRWVLGGSGDLVLEALDQADLDITVTGSGSAIASGKVQRTRAALNGSGELNLDGLAQSDIDIEIHGSGFITASGNANHAKISIFGSGDAGLGQLVVKDASVQIFGSGNVDISPEENLQVQINGSGDVRLSKQPKSVQTRINGSGSVVGAS